MAQAVEIGVLVAANLAATVLRFVLLRVWVFRPSGTDVTELTVRAVAQRPGGAGPARCVRDNRGDRATARDPRPRTDPPMKHARLSLLLLVGSLAAAGCGGADQPRFAPLSSASATASGVPTVAIGTIPLVHTSEQQAAAQAQAAAAESRTAGGRKRARDRAHKLRVQRGAVAGQFCSPYGARGLTAGGQLLTCTYTAGDPVLRWRVQAAPSGTPTPSATASGTPVPPPATTTPPVSTTPPATSPPPVTTPPPTTAGPTTGTPTTTPPTSDTPTTSEPASSPPAS